MIEHDNLPTDKWEEVSPCIYQRRTPYTPEQIERLNRRPTELINAALEGAVAFTPAQDKAP